MTETDFNGWFDDGQATRFRRQLLRWYRANHRELPWRDARDPYRIWISEIMLQQTTVAAVVPFFERFIEQFPDVSTLAAANEDDVLRLWEGLGYYSRARNIHKAAKIIASDFAGTFPKTADALQQLPGIGRYTAGAIASFAFQQPAPIVEANTLRLYCRLLGFDGDPRTTAGQKLLWAFAERLIARKSPGEFNQAVMDLGSTTCRIVEPSCDRCPVRRHCRALADDRIGEIPRPKKRSTITEVTEAIVLVRRRKRILLRRRQPGERWAGLWDFPRFEIPSDESDNNRSADLVSQVEQHTGLLVELGSPYYEMHHTVTRFRIRLLCYLPRSLRGTVKPNSGWQWVPQARLGDYPLSATGRTVAGRIPV